MTALPPLPVAVPFAVAAFLMAAAPRLSRRLTDVLSIGTAATVTVLCGVLLVESTAGPIVYWFGAWTPRDGVALGISFVIDPVGAGLALLAAALVTAALIFCWRYFDEIGPLFPTLVLVFLGAMAGFCLTGDVFNLFVFFELMSVAAYALTGHKIEEEQALMGSFNFAVTNSVGAFLVLTGIGLLYGRTGALNLAQIGEALAGQPADGLVIMALALITCGFGVKAAFVPFHFWLDDAHAVAPSPVCVLFSGVMVELGLYAIARVYWTVFSAATAEHALVLRNVWMSFGVVTALLGGVMCLAERHLKRLLAFSTISHMGMFLVGVALLTPHGLAGTALYVVGHGFTKGSLFLGAGILLNRFASVDENVLKGRARIFPWLGAVFLAGALSLSGLPPFGTWMGKSLIEESAAQLGYGWVPAVFLVASAMTAGAIMRAAGGIFLGLGPEENREAETPAHEQKEIKEDYDDAPPAMFVPAAVLAVLAVLPGVWPAVEATARRAAAGFVDRPAYAAAVLRGEVSTTAAPERPSESRLAGVLYGLGAAGAAIGIAAIGLFSHRFPRPVRGAVGNSVRPFLHGLRVLHSGHVSDYVLWMVIGVAAMGGCFAWLMRV